MNIQIQTKNIQNTDHQLTGAVEICISAHSLMLTEIYPFSPNITGITKNENTHTNHQRQVLFSVC